MTNCDYCENNSKTITNPKCPKFEQAWDEEDYVICRHVLIEDSKGFCEINYKGNTHG